jgi:hypothetical protein
MIDFSIELQQFSFYLPQTMFKIFNGNGVYWVCCFDDLIDSVKDAIACLLIEGVLIMEVEEIVNTGEEPLCVEVWQFESLNLCHSSKGPWLKVSSMLLV